MAVNRLEHDDRVVDETPHRECEAAQCEGVERLSRAVEHDQRDGERQRDGDGHDDRTPDALQKEEDHHRDEHEGLDDLFLEPVVRRPHEE